MTDTKLIERLKAGISDIKDMHANKLEALQSALSTTHGGDG